MEQEQIFVNIPAAEILKDFAAADAQLWDVEAGEEVLTLRGHDSGILGVAFSPDGHLLASCGIDRTVRIWDGTPREHQDGPCVTMQSP